jgi:hypothetical protein
VHFVTPNLSSIQFCNVAFAARLVVRTYTWLYEL